MTGGHLVRRFATSLSSRPPSDADDAWARHWLEPSEAVLWGRLSNADRRHAIEVTRRFLARRASASRAEIAGALLHDVGKLDAGLGTWGRVVATAVGPRCERFRRYHEHEAIGARWLADGGSDPATVQLVTGAGPAAPDLRAADDSI